ncbi:hypothetical protein [Rhodovibrio sodomensis]|uniref:hypothetical protein n=1 Tax=Rhodovibrio sodomensis TaxID=1088 RepID=UPI001904E3D2|nr:hypothetical protein [Rhodovibrio sodomensis]
MGTLHNIWRAWPFFAISALLFALSQTVPTPYDQASNPNWWQSLLKSSVSGMDTLANVFLFAGAAAAVLREIIGFFWNQKLESTIKDGFKNISDTVAIGITDINPEVVGAWLKRTTSDKEKIKDIGMDAIKRSYGDHSYENDSLIDYIFSNFFDYYANKNSVVRPKFTTDINPIETLPIG